MWSGWKKVIIYVFVLCKEAWVSQSFDDLCERLQCYKLQCYDYNVLNVNEYKYLLFNSI